MNTKLLMIICTLALFSMTMAFNGVQVDEPERIWITPLPSTTGMWVDPTDGTMENGLSYIYEPWPSLQGSSVNYINLYDPAYGLDPEKEYRIVNIQYCIKDKKPAAMNYTIRIIIQGWEGNAPTDTNLYEEILDTDSWSSPDVYTWTESAPITNPNVVLPGEFAIGWHAEWPYLTRFWLGVDTDSPGINWYYYMGNWVSAGYPGAYGCRLEVEEVSTGLESTTFGTIKRSFQ
ncbi:MAG: hypothetical protein ABFR50_02320 [Candidatus Fermentibacteria bacterium]